MDSGTKDVPSLAFLAVDALPPEVIFRISQRASRVYIIYSLLRSVGSQNMNPGMGQNPKRVAVSIEDICKRTWDRLIREVNIATTVTVRNYTSAILMECKRCDHSRKAICTTRSSKITFSESRQASIEDLKSAQKEAFMLLEWALAENPPFVTFRLTYQRSADSSGAYAEVAIHAIDMEANLDCPPSAKRQKLSDSVGSL